MFGLGMQWGFAMFHLSWNQLHPEKAITIYIYILIGIPVWPKRTVIPLV